MTASLLPAASLVLVVVVLLSILGAVDRRERVPFVGGLLLFILAHVASPEPSMLAAGVAVLGLLMAIGSTVPLLRTSA